MLVLDNLRTSWTWRWKIRVDHAEPIVFFYSGAKIHNAHKQICCLFCSVKPVSINPSNITAAASEANGCLWRLPIAGSLNARQRREIDQSTEGIWGYPILDKPNWGIWTFFLAFLGWNMWVDPKVKCPKIRLIAARSTNLTCGKWPTWAACARLAVLFAEESSYTFRRQTQSWQLLDQAQSPLRFLVEALTRNNISTYQGKG